MENIKLTPRLQAIADLVSHNSSVADIGTDHGYLATYLVQTGKSVLAIAADINEAPLERAKKTVAQYEVGDKVQLRLSDGLKNVFNYEVDHIIIAGMGGELIAQILSDCLWIKDKNKRLLLQPMTRSEKLRDFLCENDFVIISDVVVRDNKKLYNIIETKYIGEKKEYSNIFRYIGKIEDFYNNDNREYLEKTITHLSKKAINLSNKKLEKDIEELKKLL